MRQWSDCRTTQERRGALVDAMYVARGNVSNAAKLLGISRQHLHRVLREVGTPVATVTSGDMATGVTKATAAVTRPSTKPDENVTQTSNGPLPYGRSVRTFPTSMSSAAVTDEHETEPKAARIHRVQFDLPDDCNDWLDDEALREKRGSGRSRASRSVILIRLIRKAMQGGTE